MKDEYIQSGENENSTAVVLIDGEVEPRIVAMISEEDYFFPAVKKNGDEFILIDTGAKVTCFNLLKLYDAIDWRDRKFEIWDSKSTAMGAKSWNIGSIGKHTLL